MAKQTRLGWLAVPALGAYALSGSPHAAPGKSASEHRSACGAAATVIARGARIHGANGLALDADGHLVVASLFGSEFVVMDRDTGEVIRRIDMSALPGTDDLVIAPDGSIYFTSLGTGSVGRLSPDGRLTTRFVAPGADGIALSRDGRRLFVGLDFSGDGLYEVARDLQTTRAIVPNRPGQVPLGFVDGSAFGPDGRLYAPLWLRNMVVSIDVDSCTGTTSPWTDCDIRSVAVDVCPPVAGLRGAPTAVKFDASDRLHLTCAGGQVLRVSQSGATQQVASLAPGLDNLVFDTHNRLWVSSYVHGSITRIAGGRVELISREGMVDPGGVAVIDRPGGATTVFVADLSSLREVSPVNGRLLGLQQSIPGISPLVTPSTVSADGHQLIATAWLSNQVQVLDAESWRVLETRTLATIPVNAVRFQGAIAVAAYDPAQGVGRVVRVDTGETILGPDRVHYPLGLAASGDVLYVSDWTAGVVWKVDRGANAAALIARGLARPEGLALDGAGGLLVVESGEGRLGRIDLTTGEVATVAAGLALGQAGHPPANPPHMTLNGVAVAADGTIFVTGDTRGVLYRIAGGRSTCGGAALR